MNKLLAEVDCPNGRDPIAFFKSILWLYSLYYAEACNEFTGPIFTSLRMRTTQFLSKKRRSDGECWQHCVRFDGPEIWTFDLPLQIWTRLCSTKWPVPFVSYKIKYCNQFSFSCTWSLSNHTKAEYLFWALFLNLIRVLTICKSSFVCNSYVQCTRDGADNKKCIRMLRCVRKLCPHAAPHRIQTQLSSRCTAPHRKLNIF